MNPNLQYAQAIPGINEGRGIGLIDSRALVDVIDAVELIRPANVLSDSDYQAIKSWYGDFYQWMTTSQNGFEEDNWHNNHGTYFDMQAASFALFSDQKPLLRNVWKSRNYAVFPHILICKADKMPSWSAPAHGITVTSI